ncbi:MAG: ABC transporter permease, partial [Clostridiales bacterium]|nr:ABC transporter permease [Clostridiales bacterium]
MRKDIFREIYHTIGRFVGILVIVALGVSFFSGLGTTGDDMKLTGDFYFDSQDLMDIRVISTYGLNDRDILAIKQTPGVLSVYPAYSVDAISSKSDASVIKVHSLEEINRPVLYYGRAPTSRAECLLDASLAWDMKVGIGDVVELESGKETDIRNSLRTDRYKVVGLVRSPFYVSVERGSSSVGDGAADGYMYIPPENFLQEVYTEAFVLVEGAKDLLSFGDPYLDLVDLIVDRLEDAADVREFERYQEMTDKAFSELELARKNLEIKRTSAQLEIDEAENSILESSRQLYSASYDQTAGYAQILESLRSLDAQEAQLDAGLVTVALSQAQLESQLTGLRKTRRELQDQLFELDGQDQQLLGQLSVVGSSNPYAKAQIVAARAEISSGRSQVEDGLVEVSGGVTAILKGVEEIEAQKSSLAKSKRDLQTGRDSLEASLRSMTENTLQASDARASLDAAALELAVTKNSTKKSLDLAEKEIVAAQKSLDDLEEPQWYVLDRDATPGYASFSQDTDKIEAIGRVFPLIFFLVAALVSLTTMTRLVEERRGEIGTLKSLGYSNSAIMRKYIFYAAIPTLIGGLFGGWFGMEFFPGVIINAYSSMLYAIPPPVLKLDPKYWGIGMGAAFLCTVLAAVISCNAELRESPSSLMRPKPPKVGKRTFLEALPFLWKSLSFTQKVTLRNIIRYKKRFYMTVIGIAGCSSLLLTGFGILDSISAVMGLQYSQIRVYDLSVAFTDSAKQRDLVEVG